MSDHCDGRLLLVGTPIGDVRYVSEALRVSLLGADVIAAEDTRKFADLCRRADIHLSSQVISFFDGNEAVRTPGLVAQMLTGATVVLVSDAGMPSISDPGYRLVTACIDAQVPISVVPGPSAILAALAISGLPTDRFCFEGFLPRKTGARRARLAGLASERRTMIFFEAPHRVSQWLSDAVAEFGDDRAAVICRELTKTHEEVVRGSLAELSHWADNEVLGEITVVVAGAEPTAPDMAVQIEEVKALINTGEKPSVAATKIASAHGTDRRKLYDAVMSSNA